MDTPTLLMNVVLFGGLFTLAGGYFWKDRRAHLLRVLGSLLLAAFFAYEVVRIIEEGKDLWNVTFTAMAAPVFLFVAFQEYLSYRWDEDNESLKWITGTAFVAGLIYYGFDRIPAFSAAIVWVTAAESIWMGQLLGYGWDMSVGEIFWEPHVAVDIENASVRIILACTGIEAIVIFVGAIFATQMRRDPWADYKEPDHPRYLRLRAMSPKERALRALLITTSVIWVGNLFRNVMIIFLVEEWGWDFDFVHSDIGKSMSFVILLVLAFVTFNLMPEMLDNIAGIASLVNRKSPEERRLEELKRQREEEEKGELKDAGEEEDKGPPDEDTSGPEVLDDDDADEDEDAGEGVDLHLQVNP
jgi:exosortase/archaeosortase family protein